MKVYLTYLTFLAALLVGLYFKELRWIDEYKPTTDLLQHTSVERGRLYHVPNGHLGGWIGLVNGISFSCGMGFAGGTEQCSDVVPSMYVGADVTVAFVRVPAALGSTRQAMSIAVNGVQVYARTPEQVIRDYMRTSHNHLLFFPLLLLFLLGVLPSFAMFVLNSKFRNGLLAFFGLPPLN